jgi:sulfite exporter TauE/SafE
MELWTAFLLGLVGSLHCAGMCGPLALAMPAIGATRTSFVLGRVAYNFGRTVTYGSLGALFGLAGRTLALAGLQRWLSLGAGAAILIGLAVTSRFAIHTPLARAVAWVKSGLATMLKRQSLGSLWLLGILNGLLPCGLVYVACAASVAMGGWLGGAKYMLAFGLGTVPMMLGIGLTGRKLQPALRFRFQRFIPVSVAMLGLLLILRGMSLGIPYLSPDLSGGQAQCPACHQP